MMRVTGSARIANLNNRQSRIKTTRTQIHETQREKRLPGRRAVADLFAIESKRPTWRRDKKGWTEQQDHVLHG